MLEGLGQTEGLSVVLWTVGRQSASTSKHADLFQYSVFQDWKALEDYRAHTAHQAVVAEFRQIADWWMVDHDDGL